MEASGINLQPEDDEDAAEVWELLDIHVSRSRKYLDGAIPGLALFHDQQVKYKAGPFQILCEFLGRIRFRRPATFFQAMLPGLSSFISPGAALPQMKFRADRPEKKNDPFKPVEIGEIWKGLDQSPRVAIYHSHTSESYPAFEGKVREDNGMPGDVVRDGDIIAGVLWDKYGIAVVHSKKVHDYPVWRKSYVNSLVTAQTLVKENKDLFILLDLHRDAGQPDQPGENIAEIQGRKAARVFIVVGSDRLGLPHPHWRQNYNFALEFHHNIEKLFPGLSRGVNLRHDGRWNQHLHPHALILEIGDIYNKPDEVEYACILIARALAEMIYNQQNGIPVAEEKDGK